MKKIYALILAKGNSNRLDKKNILPFNGLPMFLNNVIKCVDIFDKTFVSSEDEDILDWADSRGAIAIKRPNELCGDTPNIPVYKHALQFMGDVDAIIAVQANSPNVDKELIKRIKDLMEEYEEIMTCHRSGRIYGSVWGISINRLNNYKNIADYYNPQPDLKIEDSSVDIHTNADYIKALKINE